MALHVPRGIYTIVVSIRLDYCRRDCATSPSWSPAMKNCREQPRGRGHVTSAGLDACVAHSASAHRDRLAWELGELAAFARRKCMEAGGFGRGELGDLGDLGKFAAFARRKCMGGWRFRPLSLLFCAPSFACSRVNSARTPSMTAGLTSGAAIRRSVPPHAVLTAAASGASKQRRQREKRAVWPLVTKAVTTRRTAPLGTTLRQRLHLARDVGATPKWYWLGFPFM
jgi:hypothetical protein